MKCVKITLALAQDACQAAKNTFPNEFIALVGSNRDPAVLDELVLVPALQGEAHALLYPEAIPFDRTIRGSLHSHPTRSHWPSEADKESFRKLGSVHLIIAYPFELENIRAFDAAGKPCHLRITP